MWPDKYISLEGGVNGEGLDQHTESNCYLGNTTVAERYRHSLNTGNQFATIQLFITSLAAIINLISLIIPIAVNLWTCEQCAWLSTISENSQHNRWARVVQAIALLEQTATSRELIWMLWPHSLLLWGKPEHLCGRWQLVYWVVGKGRTLPEVCGHAHIHSKHKNRTRITATLIILTWGSHAYNHSTCTHKVISVAFCLHVNTGHIGRRVSRGFTWTPLLVSKALH